MAKKSITRQQVLNWHDATKEVPEMRRVVLIKVPDMPWRFSGKGDIKQTVAYLEPVQKGGNYTVPYKFKEFGPGSFFYEDATEWAYLDE